LAPQVTARRRLNAVAAVALVAGAAILVWAVRAAGVDAVLDGVKRLGPGFLVVLALGGARHAVRAIAWRLCFEAESAPSVITAFAAYVSGDAIGNVTPFGVFISEPSKIVLVRNRLNPREAIAALTIENLFYGATVVMMLIAGTAALLLAFPISQPIRLVSLATLATAMCGSFALAWVLITRRRVVSRMFASIAGSHVAAVQHVREVENRVFGFVGRHRSRLLPILLLEASYHVSAVAEIWFVLSAIVGSAPPVLTAFVLEYVNRVITVGFQFVPMWLGVDEAGTGLMTTALRLGGAVGVSLALVRKARTTFWTLIGLGLLLRHGLSEPNAAVQPEAVVADR